MNLHRTLHRPGAGWLRALPLSSALLICACGKSGSGAPTDPLDRESGSSTRDNLRGHEPLTAPGKELPKPGGGTFFVDPHQSGNGAVLHVAETFWGRLVDVYDVDDSGVPAAAPRFRDFVVNDQVASDGVYLTLASDPVTGKSRLIIHAKKGSALFDERLRLISNLPPIQPKHFNAAPPFPFVARNTCLVVRFDDCLDDDAAAELSLANDVRVTTGYLPLTPFGARVRFDPNHGGLVGGAFHSTRVLIDLTVSELESADLPVPLPINAVGLPASLTTTEAANVTLRIPTRTDLGSGQATLLTNLSGVALDPLTNGPIDISVLTRDVLRAVLSGNASDLNNGFMLDLERPRLLGDMPVVVERAVGAGGRDLLVDLAFSSPCELAPRPRDLLSAGGTLLEVIEPARLGPQGKVEKLRVRSAVRIANPASLLGNGRLHPVFAPRRARRLPAACWLSFLPQPTSTPTGVATFAQVGVRFSEPMDPAAMQDLDSFLVVRGLTTGTSTANATNTVPGSVLASAGADAFAFVPLLPLAHTQGVADPYHVELTGFTDLAGNSVADQLPFANFWIDPDEPTQSNGSIVLRFDSPDEVAPFGFIDVRGQFFYDLDRGVIRPRPVSFASWPVDRTNPVPSIMIPFPLGTHQPLNPLGSKLQAVWRYCDLGWSAGDETKYNLDVAGLSWAPVGGQVIAEFFDDFEIRLAHSHFLPDESLDLNLLPKWPQSGLRGGPSLFTDNLLVDPLSPQKVVHAKPLGYTVNPADRFTSSTGTVMIPYPLNQGAGPLTTYTWRDTAVLAKAGPANQGVPMDIETGPPLFLEPQAGTLAAAGSVPSFGLPLLIEYRCYPSDTGLGLNSLDVSLAINSSPLPAFRAYSSGGFNTSGNPVVVNPDTALVPAGTFNALSSPPGQPTAFSAENVVYIGQLDTVTRVSRAHTIWLDTGAANPGYFPPLVAPLAQDLPAGTQVRLDFRGALGFSASALDAPFDATRIGPYGEITVGTVSFLNGASTWTDDIQAVDGARYLQARVTFLNNVTTGTSPELSALGIAFLAH